jgi:hypothetical protein
MLKAELFNLEDKKTDQRRAIMELTGEQKNLSYTRFDGFGTPAFPN